jgi:hypothetical protein
MWETGRSSLGVDRADDLTSWPDCNGGVGRAFGGKACEAAALANVGDTFSLSGENGGVCAKVRGGPAGLGSALGVEKEERPENRPVEDALDRVPSCCPSEPALAVLRGVNFVELGCRPFP